MEGPRGFKLIKGKIEETFSIYLAFSPDQNSGLEAEWATQFRGQEKSEIKIKLQYKNAPINRGRINRQNLALWFKFKPI